MDAWLDRLVIYAVDVGSISKHRFGWARGDVSGAITTNDNIRMLAAGVVEDLKNGKPVTLGFECPLFVPVRSEPERLLAGRGGEGRFSWSAGPGAGSLVTGLAQVAWVLREVRMTGLTSDLKPFLAWHEFAAERRGLLLWEAFVTGIPRGESHQEAAQYAVSAFRRTLPSPTSAIPPEKDVYSLIGAALLRTEWSKNLALLQEPCLVIRASQASTMHSSTEGQAQILETFGQTG